MSHKIFCPACNQEIELSRDGDHVVAKLIEPAGEERQAADELLDMLGANDETGSDDDKK